MNPSTNDSANECTREYIVNIDSRDRNRTRWTATNNFEVKMNADPSFDGANIQRSFKNVEMIEVLDVIIPNTNSVTNEMYLYLCFPELDSTIESTNKTGYSGAIAKLIPDKLIGNHIYIDFKHSIRPRKCFPFKGNRIDKLTVEFRKQDGSLFDFGADTAAGNPVNPLVQTSITLRIVVREKLIG